MSEPTRQPASASRDVARPAGPANSHDRRPGHPLADLHEAFGNLGVLRRLAEPGIQPKLEIGAPDDEHEREADRVAAAVMRKPEGDGPMLAAGADQIRRAPAPEEEKRKPTAAAASRAAAAPARPAAPVPAAAGSAAAHAPAAQAPATARGAAGAAAATAAPAAAATGAAHAAPAAGRTATPTKKTPPVSAPKGKTAKPAAKTQPKQPLKSEPKPADPAAKKASEAKAKGDAKHPTVEPKPKPPSGPKPASKPKTGTTAKDHPPGQPAPASHQAGGPPNREPWPPPEMVRRPDEPVVATKPASPTTVPVVTPSATRAIQTAQGAGQPLAPADRSFYESRLGRDLSGVRIHDNAAAHQAAKDVKAKAFTYGQDIFFGAGRNQPGTSDGRELMAHELAHTIQQRPGAKLDRKVQRQADGPGGGGPGGGGGGSPPAGTGATKTDNRITFDDPLGVPVFRTTGSRADRYAQPLIRPAGYSRSGLEPQRDVWTKDVGPKLAGNITPLLEALPAHQHDGRYFLEDKGSPPRFYVGTASEVANALAIPEWDRNNVHRGTRAFQVDHILELQIAGPDTAGANAMNNLELLEKGPNASSGASIASEINTRLVAYRNTLPPDQKSDPKIAGGAWRTNYTLEFPKGTPKPCNKEANLPVDIWRPEEITRGDHIKAAAIQEAQPSKLGGEDRVVILPSGGSSTAATLRPSQGPGGIRAFRPFRAKTATYALSPDDVTANAPVLTVELELDPGHPAAKAFEGDVPGPVTFPRVPSERFVGLAEGGTAGRLLSSMRARHFSPITIETAELGPNGIYAAGQITADLPIIRDTPIEFVLDGPRVTISHTFESGDFKLPAPLKVTGSTLTVSASSDGDIGASGRVDAEIEKLGRGFLAAEASRHGGLSLSGGFDFTSEVFQQAHVSFAYHDGRYSGEGTLSIASGKVAGLKSGTLHASYADDHFDATGHAVFDIPGIDSADIHLGYDATTGLVITAAPQLKQMPGIRSGSLSLTVTQPPGGGGLKLSGHGTAEPDIPGISAQLTVDYDDGAFLAKVEVPFQMGMINGRIEAGATNQPVGDDGRPAPAGGAHGEVRIFGAGSATMQITPWLAGTAAIRLLPNGEVEVHGDLTVPGVNLYDGRDIVDQEIIPPIAVDVPIFPPLELHLAAGLRLKVGYGPGVLSGSLGITYNPSHADDTVIHGSLHFHASAYAGLELETVVGLAIGIPGVSISADVVLGGELRIDANLDNDTQINWTPTQGVVIDNTLTASLEPALVIHLSVAIIGSAFGFSHEFWRKELANHRWGSGLHMGLTWPIHYEDGRPFQPSLDDIHLEKPDLHPAEVGKQILEQAANE